MQEKTARNVYGEKIANGIRNAKSASTLRSRTTKKRLTIL